MTRPHVGMVDDLGLWRLRHNTAFVAWSQTLNFVQIAGGTEI
jgi:hypothetical protein